MRRFGKRQFEDQRGARALAVVIGLFLACVAARALANEQPRDWSDAAGRHKLTARLQAFSQGAATLEMADGKLMEIAIEKLSVDDRKYVLAHRAGLKKPDENPFKEKNAVQLEKLETQLKKAQRQIEQNAQAANENAENVKKIEQKLEETDDG